jgi:phosphoglycerol transferase MdoB-like AlkP superfamily enzyme
MELLNDLINKHFSSRFIKKYSLNLFYLFLISLTARWLAFNGLVRNYGYINNEEPYKALDLFLELKYSLLLGLTSDFVVCLFLALLLTLVSKIIARALIAVLIFVYAANVAHIIYNMSNLPFNLAYLVSDKSFFIGSLLDKRFIKALIILLVIPSIFYWWKGKYSHRSFIQPVQYLPLLLAPVLVGLWIFLPPRLDHDDWLQTNMFTENIQTLMGGTEARANTETTEHKDLYKLALSSEEEGVPLVDFHKKVEQPNILVVFVESLSEFNLETNAAPYLHERAKHHLNYSQFIAPQLQTHRGLYSALCDDYSNFNSPSSKSINAVEHPDSLKHKCLPQYLDELGYNTSFIDSASSSFTRSGDFAETIGFTSEHSALDDHAPAIRTNGWGVDDKSFFNYVMTHIEELQQSEKPWFVSAITSGTHAPFNVPEDYKPDLDNERQRAYLYADEMLNSFLEELNSAGLLENTLVVLTADESRAFVEDGSPIYRDLVLNWIPLVIMLPGQNKGMQIDQPFSQIDLPKTVLDYLGQDIRQLPGRSALRSYTTSRPLFLGNLYKKHIYFTEDPSIITKCKVTTYQCFDIRLNDKNLFKDQYDIESEDVYYSEMVKRFIQQNDS